MSLCYPLLKKTISVSSHQIKTLGWIQGDLSEVLQALNSCGQNIIHQVLQVREGKLYPARSIKMFMATTNASIAKSDCLFYAVMPMGGEIKALFLKQLIGWPI